MGIYEEAKIRLNDIQNRINRIRAAGVALENEPTNKTSLTKFRMMYATVQRLQEEFEVQMSIIIKQLGKPEKEQKPEDKVCSPDELREKFEEAYFSIMIVADEHIPAKQLLGQNADETFIELNGSRKNTPNFIPLEKLSIPRFTGDPKQYMGFRNTFDTVVNDNLFLQPVVKFTYLKSYLEGEPLNLINNLMLSNDNYFLALKILNNRYSNRRVIAESHFKQLWEMKKAVFNDEKSIRQMLNHISESTGALKNLNYATDLWDPILLHLFQQKLDGQLRAQWELLVDTNEDPSVTEFLTFLTKFCNAASAGSQSEGGREKPKTTSQTKTTALHTVQSNQKPTTTMRKVKYEKGSNYSCQVCQSRPGHLLIACPVFKEKTPKDRHQIIKELNRCYLCFSEHRIAQCSNTRVCSECGGRHHSLLHLRTTESEEQPVTANTTMLSAANERPDRCRVLLSTVAILVQDVNGDYQEFRALLDGASESSYMTEVCGRKLGLARQKCNLVVRGMSDVQVASIKSHVNLNLRPLRSSTPEININAYVVPRITGLLPSRRVWKAEWQHLKGLELADPRYDEPMPVDILLGADVVPYVTRSGRREGTGTEPVGLETVFGWTLMGNTGATTMETANTFVTALEEIDSTLRRFWDLEELPKIRHQTPENIKCEELYTATTTRKPDGRYVVHLPFIQNPPHLGESRAMATQRLYKLEIRLEKSEELRQQYNVAMRDYLDAGHMKPVDSTETMTSHSYYTPHHVVLKPESLTTKVRVVYDASAVTSNGKSLNDCLFPGPKLQQDLSGILVRFRLHSIVFTADIRQMFRQIAITGEHHAYQRLLYRFQPTDPVQVFEMTTVTFGQRSSPFLAIRTLHQLAADEAANHPEVQKVIHTDLYVDDVATGTKCEESALQLQQDLINVFKRGGFDLRKWSSNSIALLESVPPEHRQTEAVTFDEPTSDYTKVLGLKWEPKNDTIAYQYQPNPVRYSKRAILSEIARIYDPIGLLTPVITNLKRLMKYLWALRIGWDDDLPVVAKDAWTRYHDELPFIASVCVARRITVEDANYELHGFCDSSESAYAAAAYLLARTSNGQIQVHLLMGKSKVSPEKKLSIPRLELCGALLLARTIDYLRSNLKSLPINQYYAWTDSMVTLAWINTPSANLKTFVGNRVAKIQELTSQKIWRYVPSAQNPVDCASRGLTPSEIVDHPLWWNGPTFLRQPLDTWPQQANMSDTDRAENHSEEKLITLLATATPTQLDENCVILYASSELSKVLRLAAYWLRLRQRLGRPPRVQYQTNRPSAQETRDALQALIRWVQHIHFAEDWNCLRQNRPCTPKLRMLGAYLDLDNDLIRVGGRLKNSDLPYDAKHPILLPKQSQLTILLIDYVHSLHCHPGPQTTQNILHQDYWILSARSVIRKRLHQCIPCFQAKPKPMNPMMGALPRARVASIKAFAQVGVDFAGPFWVKAALLRRIQATKGYLCIFVCMATRAVHLELVSDLTTCLFLSALNRFISRRGRCEAIYSDCGTNFVGAKNYLEVIQKLIKSDEVERGLATHQIRWHLNPPAAPHMGGLWEAAVKSAKTLLHRTIKEQILTYEELNTIFHRIEAILNSRPLGSMSSDPNDLQPLTAGHFLTLEPIVTMPTPDTIKTLPKLGLHQRWKLVQQLQQHFWERWQQEYLHTIQTKSKWNKIETNLALGDLVIIKEPTPPLTWKTARVVEVFPGEDKIVRVANVRTAEGKIVKRPAVKLCRLPLTFEGN
ncbi:uncharacterized protein LOC114128975 [Aphis gossypii]|uniref:uncharacterized protein LOC114128975 n=1 Tax=Aphis gossypii TaxID=80765 RepID=UPI002158AE8F|nr:uncharacterized protein LOC114128975 [Aphis gossypii]